MGRLKPPQNLAICSLVDFDDWAAESPSNIGGTESVIRNLAGYLKFDKIFLIGRTSNKDALFRENNVSDNLSILPFFYLPKTSGFPIRFLGFLEGRKISSLLKKYGVEVVYSHSEEVSAWLPRSGIPYVHHLHGYSNALLNAKRTVYRNALFVSFWQQLRKRSVINSGKVVAIDKKTYDLSRAFGKSGHDIVFLPNFVDTSVFYRDPDYATVEKELGIPFKNAVLFVGRISEVKGLELFVDVIEEFNRRFDEKITGIMVGKGEYEESLRTYVIGRRLKSQIHFAGSVTNRELLRKIYSCAKALLLTSLFEGVPMVLLESLACGTPALSTNVGGIPDIIVNGSNGFTVGSRDKNEFVQLLSQLIKLRLDREDIRNSVPVTAVKAGEYLTDTLKGLATRHINPLDH